MNWTPPVQPQPIDPKQPKLDDVEALCQTLGVDGAAQLAVSAAFVWPSS